MEENKNLKEEHQSKTLEIQRHKQEKESLAGVNAYIDSLSSDKLEELRAEALSRLDSPLHHKAKTGDMFAEKLLKIEMITLVEEQIQKKVYRPGTVNNLNRNNYF